MEDERRQKQRPCHLMSTGLSFSFFFSRGYLLSSFFAVLFAPYSGRRSFLQVTRRVDINVNVLRSLFSPSRCPFDTTWCTKLSDSLAVGNAPYILPERTPVQQPLAVTRAAQAQSTSAKRRRAMVSEDEPKREKCSGNDRKENGNLETKFNAYFRILLSKYQ